MPRRRRTTEGLGLTVVVLVGLALVALRFGGMGPDGGGSRATIDLDGYRLSAWSDSHGIQVAVTQGSSTVPFRVTVTQDKGFAVRQLLCGQLSFGHVVLFGVAPPSVTTSVTGLGGGDFRQTESGVFLFSSVMDATPGTEWTVSVPGGSKISGHVAGGGPRMSGDQPDTDAHRCFAFDPSIEILKP